MTPEQREHWRRQAVLYAAGALSGEECSAFEQRLGDSQEVRDLLVQAMAQWAERCPRSEPQPVWREHLRQRLRQKHASPHGWLSLTASALIGAAFATLLASLFMWWNKPTGAAPSMAQPNTAVPGSPMADALSSGMSHNEPDGLEDAAAVAYVDLTNNTRITLVQQWTAERKGGLRLRPASPVHAPLLEYLGQPCPKPKSPNM